MNLNNQTGQSKPLPFSSARAKRICVIGLGYIGLPTATVLAQAGQEVIGVDIAPEIVAKINQAQPHFNEPDLNLALIQAVKSGKFFAKTEPEAAEAFIIAVPTPLTLEKKPDLRAVFQAIESIAPVLRNGNLIILESTSPVGTTEQIATRLSQQRPDLHDLHFAYCPERVLPGNIMQEIYHNDRIIGGLSVQAAEQALQLYQTFAKGQCMITDARTAELCKLAENSFRDLNIAFANELSMLCDSLDVNVWEVIRLANHHPRVTILQPGCGVGGHCIALDPYLLISASSEYSRLMRTAREVNEHKPHWVFQKVKTTVAECAMKTQREACEIRIACLGLTFKADVDDLRESPALQITRQLAQWHSREIWVVEPNISRLPVDLQKKAALVPLDLALAQADLFVLLVDHQPFKQLEMSRLETKWLIDCRGIWQKGVD